MQNPRELLIENLNIWLKDNPLQTKFEVNISQNLKFGDFSTNIALVSVQSTPSTNPRELAEQIVGILKQNEEINQVFEKIEVAGSGFINFYLSKNYLASSLTKFVQQGKFESLSNTNNSQRNIIEFGDPNPFKEIHIGHLRNFCIGESFCRLLESQGKTVTRANYQGDVGLHVAKAMWGLLKREEVFLDSGKSEDEKVKILAQAYVEGATEFENNEEVKQEIIEINKKIYGGDESLHQLWEEGRKVSLENFEELYKKIGVRYDKYFFESITAKRGKEIVLSHIEDGVFERDDGAVVYRGEKDGLHTRVFITSQEYATYEGKDLALAILKKEDGDYERSVILTGNEQLEYFQVMLAALKRIEPEVASKTSHFTFGHVKLKEGKMSSRTGDVISANWLIDEAIKRVRAQFNDMDPLTSEKVGIAAVKYSMLKFSIPSDIHFSFEESITLEGNSGPYLQYAYVRTQSVLQKLGDISQESKSELLNSNFQLQNEETDLLRFLSQYPYHVEKAATEFAPNLLCNYLFELAQKFNLFYQKCKIIGDTNESFRLELTRGVGAVLQNGLHLLGIETVEKM
jgi:arginyl-tRNA synthetase